MAMQDNGAGSKLFIEKQAAKNLSLK